MTARLVTIPEFVPQLLSGEEVVATFSGNIRPDLSVGHESLVLTNQRLFLSRPEGHTVWPVQEIRDLDVSRRNGLTTIG